MAFANEFMSKRNATLPCCTNEISQNLQKQLFLSVTNKHRNKVHAVIFFQQPLPAHDYGMRIKVLKRFCPLPPPLTPTNETSYWGPCTLSRVNNVQKQLPGGVL